MLYIYATNISSEDKKLGDTVIKPNEFLYVGEYTPLKIIQIDAIRANGLDVVLKSTKPDPVVDPDPVQPEEPTPNTPVQDSEEPVNADPSTQSDSETSDESEPSAQLLNMDVEPIVESSDAETDAEPAIVKAAAIAKKAVSNVAKKSSSDANKSKSKSTQKTSNK